MTTILENRKIELVVTGLTASLIVLTILTYILDQQKSNWICGPALFFMELIAIGLHAILNIAVWTSKNRTTKIVLMIISIGLLTFITWGFINFNIKCS